MADETAQILLKQFGSLETQRQTWESHWQEVADYVVPRKADVTKNRSPGDKRSELVFDGTAIHAAELLSASLHGMLTNGSTSWFSLRYSEPELNTDDEAMEWLQGVEDVMYQAFNRSNFQEQISELYQDLVTFGTAVMFVDADEEQQIRFSSRHIRECFLSEDDKGRVDTVFRKFKMPARAAVARFGEEKLNTKILKKASDNPYEQINLIHAVYERQERDVTKVTADNKPFASIYIEPEEKIVLSESGFDEFPYMVPRWSKVAGEIYGRSPSMTSLPDIKMVNAMMKTIIKAAQKITDPPLLVPDDGFILPVRTVPGGLNFYRSGTQDRIEPLETRGRPDIGFDLLNNRREHIKAAFHVDWMQMPDQKGSPNMTATEVVARQEEKMRLMGPMIGRLQVEFLGPLIDRVFKIMMRKKQIPQPPGILEGQEMKILYTSPLARAQKSGQLMTITRLFESMVPLFQAKPDLLDNMNTDETFRYFHHLLDAPAKILNPEEKVQEERQQRQEQQEQMMQAEQAKMESESAKNISEAQAKKREGVVG